MLTEEQRHNLIARKLEEMNVDELSIFEFKEEL